jgi:hypothetical protein
VEGTGLSLLIGWQEYFSQNLTAFTSQLSVAFSSTKLSLDLSQYHEPFCDVVISFRSPCAFSVRDRSTPSCIQCPRASVAASRFCIVVL